MKQASPPAFSLSPLTGWFRAPETKGLGSPVDLRSGTAATRRKRVRAPRMNLSDGPITPQTHLGGDPACRFLPGNGPAPGRLHRLGILVAASALRRRVLFGRTVLRRPRRHGISDWGSAPAGVLRAVRHWCAFVAGSAWPVKVAGVVPPNRDRRCLWSRFWVRCRQRPSRDEHACSNERSPDAWLSWQVPGPRIGRAVAWTISERERPWRRRYSA